MSVLINPYALAPVLPAAAVEPQTLTTPASQGSNVFTVNNVPIGAAAVGRRVFILVHYHNATALRALTSATIGGVAATIHTQAGYLVYGVALISAPLDAGATTTVVLTFASGGSTFYAFLKPYKVTGLLSATPVDTDTFTGSSGTDGHAELTLNVEEGGILLSGATETSNAGGFALTGVDEDYDSAVVGSQERIVGGSLAVTATEADRVVSYDRGGSGSSFNAAMIAAAFR